MGNSAATTFVRPTFTKAEQLAAADLGIELKPVMVHELRTELQEKAKRPEVAGPVQYYVLIEDKVWTEEQIDLRIFGALRLLHEYLGTAGSGISNWGERTTKLKALILRLAKLKGDTQVTQKVQDAMSPKLKQNSAD